MKRLTDIFLSTVMLVILLPLMLVSALLIRLRLGSPILFAQDRIGMAGKPFRLRKFRSMTTEHDNNGNLLPDSVRLPDFGRKLRSTSLDELPSLINVLRGEMSIVGPRPLLPEYMPLYNAEQHRRHEVRPGITGWAQIHGRNAISWEEKFTLDVWYVDNQSLWLDIKIIYRTVFKVFKKDGIQAEGEVTMPRFTGSKSSENDITR